MFEGDVRDLDLAGLLAATAEHHAEKNRLDVRLLELALHCADLNHPDSIPGHGAGLPGGERGITPAGPDTPPIREFILAEFGAMIGISAGAAGAYIGDALVLRHKLPRTFAMVLGLAATPWKARKIAAACRDLTQDAAAIVDRKVCGIIDTLTPQRLHNIVTAALWQADPEAAEQAARQKARERGVFVGRSNDHGTKSIYVLAATGDVIRFDATIDTIAQALKTLGDTTALQTRRAKAIGILADPHYAAALLTTAREHAHTTQTTQPAQDSTPAPQPPPAPTTPSPNGAPSSDTPNHPGPSTAATSTTAADSSTPASTPATQAPATTSPNGIGIGNGSGIGIGNQPTTAAPTTSRTPGPAPTTSNNRPTPEPTAPDSTSPDSSSPDPDRDAPHPGDTNLPNPADTPTQVPVDPQDHSTWDPDDDRTGNGDAPDRDTDADIDGQAMDPAAQRALAATLARIKQQAHTTGNGNGNGNGNNGSSAVSAATASAGRRPGKTEIFVHLTDQTLKSGTGVLRVEGVGPMLASQLAELIGHGPYVVKPVIDLNKPINVNAYEIPDHLRERIRLTYPVEQFPYGNAETTPHTDIDHLKPYDPTGPPGQTNTENLVPLRRLSHRLKTLGRWRVQRLDDGALNWTSPHGFRFRVDHRGTHRIDESY